MPFREVVGQYNGHQDECGYRSKHNSHGVGEFERMQARRPRGQRTCDRFRPGYRIYFAEAGRVIVVLLCGGDKSSQIKDIKKAQDLWEKYSDDAERFQ